MSAGVIAVLVAGLGGPSGRPVSDARVRNLIHAAARAINHTPSTKFTITTTISDGGRSVDLHMAGISSRHPRQSMLRTTGVGVDQTVLSINHVVYVTVPPTAADLNRGKHWLAVRSQRPTAQQRQLRSEGPAGYLKAFATAGGKILDEGTKMVAGVATTEYSLHIKAASIVGPILRKIYPQATPSRIEAMGLNDVPVQIWLDRGGLAREMTLQLAYQGLSVSEVMYLHPSNQPPDVTAPPATSVHRVATLHQFLGELRSMVAEQGQPAG